MAEIVIYHNPRCSTSRKTLDLLRDAGVEPRVVEYLKVPLTRDELLELIEMLEDPPADLVRKDSFFKDLGLEAVDYATSDSVADLLVEHPRLMQRPVVAAGGKALIARPVERAMDLVP